MTESIKLNSAMARLKRPAWLFFVLAIAAIVVFHWLGIETSFEPPFLLFALNALFIGVPSFVIAVTTVRCFLQAGVWPVLWLGVGAVTFGLGTIVSGLLITQSTVNTSITTGNLLFFVGAILHLVGAFFAQFNVPSLNNYRRRLIAVLQVYLFILALVILVNVVSIYGLFQPFFIQGQGGTIIRQFVLSLTALFFLLSGMFIFLKYRQTKSDFFYWYSLGLLLISLGMAGVLMLTVTGTPLNWAARTSLMAGGLYLLMASVVTFREARLKGISASQALTSFFQREEAQLRLLFESILEAVIVTDNNFIIRGWNKAAEKIYGWEAAQVMGRPAHEILQIRDLSGADEQMFKKEILTTGIWKSEVRQRHKSGQDLYVMTSISVLKDEQGQPVGTVSINSDITERRKAEAKIRQQMLVIQAINRIFQHALRSQTEKELGEFCLKMADEITGSQFGFIAELRDQMLRYIALSNPGGEICNNTAPQGQHPLVGHFKIHGLYGSVLKNEESLLTNDPSHHPDSTGTPPGHPPLQSFLGVPLKNENKTIGLIAVANRREGYTPEQQKALEQLAPAIVEAFLRKRAEERLVRYKNELEIKVKERTAALEQSEEKYRLLVENANESVMVFQDGRLKFFNDKSLELSGYSRDELAAKPFTELVHPDDRDLVDERHRKRIRREDVPASYEFRILHKDSQTRWVEINAVMITWEGRPAVLGLLTDVTQRKNMEQELKAYAQRITQVQEEERKRIAYELHDDTAQYLAILKLQIDSLLQSGKISDPEVLKKLEYLEKDAGRAVDDVRRYSHELRPGVLEHLGLQAALDQTVDDINKLKQITAEVNVEGEEPDMSEDVKLGFFRIAQEALNNCRKHAKASKAVIYLNYSDHQAEMVINDNGTGFDVREAKTRASLRGNLGLMSMQERAKLIGADLKIESQPGQGTTVRVKISL
jgi:PAS domain S-box-containing protein